MPRGAGITKKLKPSKQLAALFGSSDKISRGDAIGKLWKYIKKKDLKDADDGRIVNVGDNEKMEAIFGKAAKEKRTIVMRGKKIKVGKGQIFMTEIAKVMSKHLE